MLINGEEKSLACPTALSELLTQLGYRTAFVAVELNGNIIKQADFGSTTERGDGQAHRASDAA